MNFYQEVIRETAARHGYIGINARHIEAWMRVGHATLDVLDRQEFYQEVRLAIACIRNQPTSLSESLSRSYGLY